MKDLKYFGRDIENLLTQIKRVHSRRVFTKKLEEKTLITQEDMNNGLEQFLSFNKPKNEGPQLNMYI